jgi:molecular chaperone GrpE (heat shock protein)
MRELKRLVLLVAGLAFVGGGGLGAFVGTLAAAERKPPAGVDRRLDDFRREYPMDESQVRRVRDLLLRHDLEVETIRRRITSEQAREIDEVHRRYQEAILDVVDAGRR